MSSDNSDVEMSSPLPKKVKKTPKSPTSEPLERQESKKLTTKEMIHKTLSASKSRKGISLYAIKKYMHENFNADIDKINHLIKKNIKESVEAGTIVQTKGIGASGSFRLAPGSRVPKNPSKKPNKTKEAAEKEEKLEKPKKTTSKNAETKKITSKNADHEGKPKKIVAINATTSKAVKVDKKKSKLSKLSSIEENPKAGRSVMKTPKKKAKNAKNMMKRRSIGSIIKPPKMKPAKTK